MLATANAEVSWSTPTLTQPVLPPRRRRRRDRLAQLGVGEVVHVDPFRLARGLPFDPGVGELADQFLFLGVHADDRLPGGQVGGGLVVEVIKLGITVGVLGRAIALSAGRAMTWADMVGNTPG